MHTLYKCFMFVNRFVSKYSNKVAFALRDKKFNKMGLTAETIEKVKDNPTIVADLCVATKKSWPTIMRWLKNNDPSLTRADVLAVICKSLNLSQKQVLDKTAA